MVLMHNNEYKKLSLFKKVNTNSFFLFGYYMGTQPTQVFKKYKASLQPTNLQLERYRDSFFFKDNKLVYPILKGEFFFFFPKDNSINLDNFALDKTTDLLTDSEVFSQYFFPYCLGTSKYLISFDNYKYFRSLSRLSSLRLKEYPKNLFFFSYLFVSFLSFINILFLRFSYGYFKSIN